MNADISDRAKENADTKDIPAMLTAFALQTSLIHLIKSVAEIADTIMCQANSAQETAEVCIHTKNVVAQAILTHKTSPDGHPSGAFVSPKIISDI